jgi:mannose-6-phosphate isomerase
MHLKTGEWFLIEADIPHAYIQGELMECMINSDNVVRGGLTPKLKDINTLLEMLPY